MTIPNSFSSGTTITSASVNANFTDIATEITGSLPRDGQANMTGQLKASSGSAAAPGVAFGSDLDTGLFRKAADALGIAAGGSEVASATSTAFTIAGLTATSAALTTPTIAGATLAGTLAGTPTFSGAVTFGAAPTLSDGLTVAAGTTTIPSINIENADTTITRASAGVIAVEGSSVLLASDLASQSVQETGTSTTKIVTSGTQKFHPLSPKAWALVALGTSPSITAGSGVASVTRPNTGQYDITLSPAMSSANYAVSASIQAVGDHRFRILSTTASVVSVQVLDADGSSSNSAVALHMVVMGDLA